MRELKEIKTKIFANGFVSLLHTDDGRPIEVTGTCLPMETELRGQTNARMTNEVDVETAKVGGNFWNEKVMIGVSTMSGCPVRCKFCAVNKVTEKYGSRNLSQREMWEQVTFAIDKIEELYGVNILYEQPYLFRILFTRMGEPAYNAGAVANTIKDMGRTFPRARFQVSTVAPGEKTYELIVKLIQAEVSIGRSCIEYQFSIHSTDDEYRRWLQCHSVLSNEEVGELAKLIMMDSMERDFKVTLNFTLSEDTPFDAKELIGQFNPDHVFIKLSPINENEVSDENGLHSRFTYKNSI